MALGVRALGLALTLPLATVSRLKRAIKRDPRLVMGADAAHAAVRQDLTGRRLPPQPAAIRLNSPERGCLPSCS
jgi:hypothetical protein